jgi:hypothetical protein
LKFMRSFIREVSTQSQPTRTIRLSQLIYYLTPTNPYPNRPSPSTMRSSPATSASHASREMAPAFATCSPRRRLRPMASSTIWRS